MFDVAVARGGDAVFRAFKLGHQVLEIAARLEVGVVFRDGKQAREAIAQLALRSAVALQGGGVAEHLWSRRNAADPCARRGDFGQQGLFVFGVAFDGFDQIGDEIGAALVLVDDFRPGGIHALIGALQAVVEGDAVSAEEGGEAEKDEGQAFHKRLQ